MIVPTLLTENVVIVIEDGKSYRLLSQGEVNSWKVRVCSPQVPTGKVANSVIAFIETREFGNSRFLADRVGGQSNEEIVATLYRNIEAFQVRNALEQRAGWIAWSKQEGRCSALH